MPAIARSSGSDSVLSPDGTGYKCRVPMTTSTFTPGQSKVRAQGIFVVVSGDLVAPHPRSGCVPDTSTLSSFSSKVRAAGKGVGRIGDRYGDNTITSGSSKVMAA
jgi:uncharacterized Zn-binding protein involved in type VI secretion